MKLFFLFSTQVFAQKTECIFCSAKYIDGIGIIDGDASCFEGFLLFFFLTYIEKNLGTTEPYPTSGAVCGSEISKYSWNNRLDVYMIDRFSKNPYDDDEWMVAGKFSSQSHMTSVLRLP